MVFMVFLYMVFLYMVCNIFRGWSLLGPSQMFSSFHSCLEEKVSQLSSSSAAARGDTWFDLERAYRLVRDACRPAAALLFLPCHIADASVCSAQPAAATRGSGGIAPGAPSSIRGKGPHYHRDESPTDPARRAGLAGNSPIQWREARHVPRPTSRQPHGPQRAPRGWGWRCACPDGRQACCAVRSPDAMPVILHLIVEA